ncbi:tricorn protease [Muriicola jejuensis]|uniref:Tricorn protease homolog n=1 Tax=Muriicola jejuensis TaxID=504488 RepID=A0A6P0U944_9FLAO|nr:S41 family peptidase [Muriicola jejuensis]NER09725.1 protease [Muriicola jejuensis]SMP06260.1 tricorn protease [Muriicola jejuensis]
MKTFYILVLLLVTGLATGQGTQLLRQPTISDEKIVFVYANDLWIVPVSGGQAQRLTSNEGYEFSPHFSDDGSWIAFTAEYDGNSDVYIIPVGGGEPKRLTWHPGDDVVQGWTPDGKVLFRSGREARPTQTNKLYTVSPEGGLPQAIAVPRAAYGEISQDGKYVAYTPITSWDPEWRNYRGGQAMPIWIVDLATGSLQRTPQPTAERHLDPVWYNGKVFYLSERDLASNIWSFDPATGQEQQHTFHKKFDVKSLDSGPGSIVYEQGGYLHILNPETNATSQLVVEVRGDMNFARPRWEEANGNDLGNAGISPSGKRALFEYRGEVFSIPKEKGTYRNLSNSPGVADRYPVWSPQGDKIAWFSDASGEYQLVVTDQEGQQSRSYPLPNPTFYFQPDWSPDGNYIAYSDTDYNIWIIELGNGSVYKAATDRYAHPDRTMNPVWSPDSRWIAYSKQLNSHFKAVFAYDVQSKKEWQLTDGMADAISPVWDEGGEYLYFLASTNYGLQSGWLDMSSYDPQVTRRLYALVLSASGKAPNLPESDEEKKADTPDPAEKKSKKKGEDEEADKKVVVKIDPQGIYSRIIPLELAERNYVSLAKGPKHQLFIAENVPNERNLKIHSYDVKKEKAEEFATNISEFIPSSDRKNVLLRQNGAWFISETKGSFKNSEGKLDTNIKLKVDPQAEYKQIFKEGWRFMRDFLYVDNVHGAPWDLIYQWYSPWIDHVRHRTDLNYVVDIMSGEVAIGHSYVSGGDFPDIENVPVGLLGCELEVSDGLYKISKIYTGEQWNPDLDAPLHLPGIDVKTGDYILAINGKKLTSAINPYSLLEQTAEREIQLTISSTPDAGGAREILIRPVRNEYMLRTMDWIEGNRRKVDALSGGKLAYVYVPNTGGRGFEYFNRYYFSQQDKKGVIIDERNNGGGSAADYMIDIMDRTLLGYFNSKANDNRPWTTPMAGIWGPKVMIINERAGSGGDLLPYMFKAKNLGPLVGTRTWGGLVGTWDTPRFIDGGRMVAPRGGFFDVNGKWAVEGEGVAPDIEVIQDPKKVLDGGDPQLERSVQEAMRLLETQEFFLKPEPEAPVRWMRPPGYLESKD